MRTRLVGTRTVRIVPILLILAGAAADLFAPQPYTGLPLLAAAPLAACIVLPFRGGSVIAAVTCVISIGVDLQVSRPASALVVDLAVVMLVSAIALWLNQATARQRGHLAVARDIAEAAQRAVLPSPPAQVGHLVVATRYEAAQAEARIGGDLYAVQNTPFGVRAIVGDVRGKGLQAVSDVSVVIGAFREAAERAPTLEDLALQLDHALDRDRERDNKIEHFENFTTALLAEVAHNGGTVTLLSRGHPSPYLVHEGNVTALEPTAPQLPLGTGLYGRASTTSLDTFLLPPDSQLLFVTDGITEARNKQGDFYDPSIGLARRTYRHPRQLVDTLVRDITQWTSGQRQDDMAILALTHDIGCLTPS